jgi:OmpA-OmpF porin, OOP family
MASKMAPDLLNQITKQLSGDSLNQIASIIGETPTKTQSALSSLVPATLSSLAGKAATTQGANDVLDLIRKNNLTSVDVGDLARPGGATNLSSIGRSIENVVFGNKLNSITDWTASHFGMNRASVSSLTSIALPVILGLLGRRLGSSSLNPSSLASLLGSPGGFLHNAPSGLVSALGLGGAATAGRRLSDDIERVIEPQYHEKRSSVWRWLLPLLLAAGVLGLLAYFLSQRQQPVTVATPQPAPVAPAPVAPAPVVPSTNIASLGAFIDSKLPNGVNLHIPSNGVESKLLAFINDPSKAVDKDTWFSFDRLEFETDSAKLKPSSREQLSNMAAILKAYPQVDVKIGGYTDNTGNPQHNSELSKARATSTMNEMVSLGVAKSRLAAEGYGEQFPVADNATEEGRQRNRRIDIRVTKK